MANLDGSSPHGGRWDALIGATLRDDPARFSATYRVLLRAARAEDIGTARLPDFLGLEHGGKLAPPGREELTSRAVPRSDPKPDDASELRGDYLMPRQPPPRPARRGRAHHLSRRFVRQTDVDDGIAWCMEVHGRTATLRYTDVPGAAEEIRAVPVEHVDSVELPYRTRVWLHSRPFGWMPAEVVRRLADGRYLVGVPGIGDLPVQPDQIRVRWNRPLSDPAVAVAHGLVEDREYYDARQPLVRNIVNQRAAYKGFTSAASAAVLPFQHQLNVLSRVMGDPVMRFLLADEVGLGKTIEAGLVIRQLLLDDPHVNVAVLVPEVLVGQWISELSNRLSLAKYLPRIFVARYEAIADVSARKRDLLIVDEAHRIFEPPYRNSAVEQKVIQAAHQAPGLLLLTGTPMHNGENGFLRLLNLIDPAIYRLDDIDSFRRRLQMRQEQASQIELLRPGVPAKLILKVLGEFSGEYGSDEQLLSLLDKASNSVEENLPDQGAQLAAVADHLRETYRLSRRVIRQRRDAARTRGYPVSGRWALGIGLQDPARPLLDNFLDDWRELVVRLPVTPEVRELFSAGVRHVLAGPGPALEFMGARLSGDAGRTVTLDSTENALLRNTVAALEMRGTNARADCIAAHILSMARRNRKVLVFTSFTSQAGVLADALRRGKDTAIIAFHLSGMTPVDQDYEIYKFLHNPACGVMIADGSAAEGRNFQMVDELINHDLPLSANALEQRIGRADRFNLRAKPTGTLCAYLVEEDSPWTQGLQHFLADVAGVFRHSVATLQRPLDNLETRVNDQLLGHGYQAFDISSEEAQELLEKERTELDLLSEIEDAQFFSDFSDASFDDLLKFEKDSQPLADAFHSLMRPNGGIGIQAHRAAKTAQIFEFRLSDSREGVRGLSLDECEEIRQILPGKRAFDKVVAATQPSVTPIRIGDPMITWLTGYLRSNERGQAIAVLKRTQRVKQSQLWFGFDYLLEFDDAALSHTAAADQQRLRRRGDAFFGPRIETVWTDGLGEAPGEVLALLSDPDGASPTIEEALRGRTWQAVLPHFPDWTQRCGQAATLATEMVRSRPSVTAAADEAAALAAAEAERRLRVMTARAALYPDGHERERASMDLVREAELADQVDLGLRRPRAELLACLAIVLMPADA
jgi:hypothetical protein